MRKPIIYIFLNKGLQMSVGKAAAQAAHAAAISVLNSTLEMRNAWEDSNHKTIIILEARDDSHIHNIYTYLLQRNYNTHKIVDEGVNEIDPHSVTALASEILDKDSEFIEEAFSTFKLYKNKVRVVLEIEQGEDS